MRKRLLWLALSLLVLAAALPYWTTDFARNALINALETALSRPVRIEGRTRLQLLPRPAVIATDVQISDDPAFSLEPFAYVSLLEVQPSLRALLGGQLSARRMRLTEPSVNLMRTGAGWNLQTLFPKGLRPPELEVRNGRLNFKNGDSKSPFYLRNALVDLSAPSSQGDVRIFVSAEPARTDRGPQGFGGFSLRGSIHIPASGPPEFDLDGELAPSAIHAFNFFFGARGVDFAGRFSGKASIRGAWNEAAVSLAFRFDGLDPQGLLPLAGRGNQLVLKGQLDWPGQRFALDTVPGENFRARLRIRDFFQSPRGALLLDLRNIPLPRLLELGRQADARIPPGVEADGLLNGVIGYSWPSPKEVPARGMVWFSGASLAIPDEPSLQLTAASAIVDGSRWRLAPAEIRVGAAQAAVMQAEWDSLTGALRLDVATQLLNVRSLKSGLGLLVRAANLPLLGRAQGGSWQGNLRYERNTEEEAGDWSGRFLIRNAALSLEGLNAPLQLSAASIIFDRQRVNVQRIRADYEGAEIEGSASWATAPGRPVELRLILPEANPVLVQSLLQAAVRPSGSLFEKLRPARTPLPNWLAQRQVKGQLLVKSFPFADGYVEPLNLMVDWQAARLQSHIASSRYILRNPVPAAIGVEGDLDVQLWEPALSFHFNGKLSGLPAESGPVDLLGSFRTATLSARWTESLEGEGELSRPNGARLSIRGGRVSIEFPEAQARPPLVLAPPYWPLPAFPEM